MTHPLIEKFWQERSRHVAFLNDFKVSAFIWAREELGLIPGDLFRVTVASPGYEYLNGTHYVVSKYIKDNLIICPQASRDGRVYLRQSIGGVIRAGYGVDMGWSRTGRPAAFERICGQADRDVAHDYWIETCKGRDGLGRGAWL